MIPQIGCQHPHISRRTMLQAGSIGLLGLEMNHVSALREAAAKTSSQEPPARAVIYIFLSGGLSQLDSFDLKPSAPSSIRGEFMPIATSTPGVSICEHLPLLARQSNKWALVRSLTHPYNDHSQGHMVMLSGRTPMPPAFNGSKPQPRDWPSIAAIAGDRVQSRNNLPPAVVLPERLIHRTGRVRDTKKVHSRKSLLSSPIVRTQTRISTRSSELRCDESQYMSRILLEWLCQVTNEIANVINTTIQSPKYASQ